MKLKDDHVVDTTKLGEKEDSRTITVAIHFRLHFSEILLMVRYLWNEMREVEENIVR